MAFNECFAMRFVLKPTIGKLECIELKSFKKQWHKAQIITQ